MFSDSAARVIASIAGVCETPGSRPAKTVTCRCRFSRLISDGAVPGVSRAMFSSGTLPIRLDGTVSCPIAAAVCRSPSHRADVHLVLLAAFVVCGDLVAADQQPQRLGRVRDLDAEVRRLQPIEMHRQLRLADVQRRVDVDDARFLLAPPRRRAAAYFSSSFEVGPVDRELDLRVLVAAAADRRHRPDARAQVRQPRAAAARSSRTSFITAN